MSLDLASMLTVRTQGRGGIRTPGFLLCYILNRMCHRGTGTQNNEVMVICQCVIPTGQSFFTYSIGKTIIKSDTKIHITVHIVFFGFYQKHSVQHSVMTTCLQKVFSHWLCDSTEHYSHTHRAVIVLVVRAVYHMSLI